jgi:hypothetical protein
MFHPSKVKQYVLEKEQATGRNVQERRLFNQYLKKYLKKYLQAGGAEGQGYTAEDPEIAEQKFRNNMCCNDESKGWNGEEFDPENITCSENVQTTEESYEKCKTYKDKKCNEITDLINEDTTLDEHEWFLNMSKKQQLGDECEDKICKKMKMKVEKYFKQAMDTKDLEEKQKMLGTLDKYAKTCDGSLSAKIKKLRKEEAEKQKEEAEKQKEEAEKQKEQAAQQKEEAEKGGCAIM